MEHVPCRVALVAGQQLVQRPCGTEPAKGLLRFVGPTSGVRNRCMGGYRVMACGQRAAPDDGHAAGRPGIEEGSTGQGGTRCGATSRGRPRRVYGPFLALVPTLYVR